MACLKALIASSNLSNSAYKKAIGINSDKDEAYYNMGGVYTILNKFEKAIKAYKEAIEINPNKYGAYNNMGLAYTGFHKP
jgi:tetratricopeptide (TPR) repeat protein